MLEWLKQYGLGYCDFPTMLSNVSAMLRMIALNIDGRHKNGVSPIYIILTILFTILSIYTWVISAFWFTFRHAVEIGAQTEAFIMMSLNLSTQVPFIKLFYMMYYEQKFQKLTSKYLALDAHIPKGSRFSTNMLKSLRRIKRRGIMYWLIIVVDCVLYVIKPLVTPGRHICVENYVIYGLDPMKQTPNYEIASTVLSISVVFIGFVTANVTCFLILIIGYIEAQMLSLSNEMINIYDDAVYEFRKTEKVVNPAKYARKVTKAETLNKFIKDRLVNIITKHTTNLKHLKEIEVLMRGPNIIVILYLIIGLTAELLGGLNKTYLQLPYTMLQISVDCFLGQKVMDANIKFEQAVYSCKWEKFDAANRKVVLLLLQNSQKTMTLSAGGMVMLTFSTLENVVQNTYSAYTTLNQIV